MNNAVSAARLHKFRQQLMLVGASAVAFYRRFLTWQLFADQLAWVLACEQAVDAALAGREWPRELLLLGARQTGKNQSDGAWTVRGLCKYGATCGGQAIKSAPTYKPQISVSKRRLRKFLNEVELMRGFWETEEGYIFRFLKAAIAFLSAQETANRVGETADLWLGIDECQNTSIDVFNQDFSPMRAFRAVPVFYMGTAWTKDCLLAVTRRRLEMLQQRDGIQRVFLVPWELRALDNPKYGEHVEKERDRLGATHRVYRSQYCLEEMEGVGSFLDVKALRKLFGGGDHPRMLTRRDGQIYVAGIDYCGAGETPKEKAFDLDRAQKRDSTLVAIGELYWREQKTVEGNLRLIPCVRVVNILLLPDRPPEDTTDEVDYFVFVVWRCMRAHSDKTGVGDGPSAMLEKRRPGLAHGIQCTAPANTRMGHRLEGAINSNRFTWWKQDDSPEWKEAELQFRLCEGEVTEGGQFRWHAPTKQVDVEGKSRVIHDDIPKACGLLIDAAYDHLASFQDPENEREQYEYWDETAGMAA